MNTNANGSSTAISLAGTGPHRLSDRHDLVPGVDQLHGDDVVAGQGLLVLLVDHPYGLVAMVGPEQERLEDRLRVVQLDQEIEVARLCASNPALILSTFSCDIARPVSRRLPIPGGQPVAETEVQTA